jgi:hypothetical protein
MKTKSASPQVFFDGIDRARLDTFKPVKQAIEALNLPPLRFRKLNGILNALTMQIEDGGDSSEVNELLVKALRAAIIFQVGEAVSKSALDALAQFEQSEALRLRGKKSA